MNSRGRKAKGRAFQQQQRDMLLNLLPEGKFDSQIMSVPGTDIMDPLDQLPWPYTECRNLETWPSLVAIVKEMESKVKSPMWAYTLKKNRQSPIWVVPQTVMEALLSTWFDALKRARGGVWT